ncbi:MAG: ethanolamine utilization protein EutH [Lentisphaeria bacterium]|nr:ethanolamine utilization protein EutH [Lentisphaeria bacterium]
MEAAAMFGISAAVFMEFSGIKIPGIVPIAEAFKVIGSIVVLLAGVYVFMEIFSRIFRKWLLKTASLLKINEMSVMGFMTTLANSIPTLSMIKDMDPRGKLLNCVFMSSGAFMIGDHLAYCGAIAPELLFPMLVTKATAAVSAVLLAMWCTGKNPDLQ